MKIRKRETKAIKTKPGRQSGKILSKKKRPGATRGTVAEKDLGQTGGSQTHSREDFPVVGIGASAGGLAAFEAFFSGMPADTDPGMAFVLVQHLAPDHESILTELVRRYTRLQVYEVTDGTKVKINCAYIIPPNRDMSFVNGSLYLSEPTARRGLRLPIDFFFHSLAQDQRERAIGIVLSGSGSDGTLGVRAIKGEGGLVMAQNPESTEYDGMPRSAIQTGLVDFVMPPAEMPTQLIAYLAHAFGKPSRAASPATPRSENALKKVFLLLKAQTGHDFSQYKPNTIHRRVERRMAVQQIETMDGYFKFLQQAPDEVKALFHDLLIGVTRFFRDPEVFKVLEEIAIPKLFAGKPVGAAVRVWVPGCSTGEEAYSIAILLQERLETLNQAFKVQIFATDIDSRAIDQARAGFYPASNAADLTPERLARFFVMDKDSGNYRIQKSIRDLIVFSKQDTIKEPPFSKLDLVSCRNVLIYMGGELQKKLIPLFHYALNPGGILFLGTSETIGEFVELFSVLDRKAKIFQRKENIQPKKGQAWTRFIPPLAAEGATQPPKKKNPKTGRLELREFTERALLQQFSPVGALVDEHGDILYLHGRTGRYLEPSPGHADMNILTMAREGLRGDLNIALHKAVTLKSAIRSSGLRVRSNGDFTMVNLTVRPAGTFPDAAEAPGPDGSGRLKAGAAAAPGLFLVIFEEMPAADQKIVVDGDAAKTPLDANLRIAALKRQLRAKEEHLQISNQELATAGEEYKSANEEMQSVNEELQSTNEELETTKEELQSVNEELATVNAELQDKVTNLSRTNNDLKNLMASTGIGTIFVDQELNIQRFTSEVTQVINLILSDMGRPLAHVVSNFVDYDRLVADVREVLDTLIPKEFEVRTRAGAWYFLRIRPYRTLENVIDGAVITFTEITEIKKAQAVLQESANLRLLSLVVHDSNDAVTVLDLTGRILAWNPGAVRIYGWSEAEALKLNIGDMVPENIRLQALTRLRELIQAKDLSPYRTQKITKDGRIVEVWITASALVNEAGKVYAISTTEREIGGPSSVRTKKEG